MTACSILAVAASTGKIGFVYLRDDDLLDWGISPKASTSVDAAYAQMTGWLNRYHPDLVIVEYLDGRTRKGPHTRALVESVLAAARSRTIAWERIVPPRRHPNKYAAASALAEQFPQIAPWLPIPRGKWRREPNNIIYFEALSLAVEWLARREPNGALGLGG